MVGISSRYRDGAAFADLQLQPAQALQQQGWPEGVEELDERMKMGLQRIGHSPWVFGTPGDADVSERSS